MRPVKTQISLRSLISLRCLPEEALGPLIAQQRLIWVFAGHVILLVLSCSGYSNILHSPLWQLIFLINQTGWLHLWSVFILLLSRSLHAFSQCYNCEVKLSPCKNDMSPVKRICVFEHSVITNFSCACSAIQRGQGSDFLSEGSSWFTACMSEQRRFWRDCADAQARLNLRCSHRW